MSAKQNKWPQKPEFDNIGDAKTSILTRWADRFTRIQSWRVIIPFIALATIGLLGYKHLNSIDIGETFQVIRTLGRKHALLLLLSGIAAVTAMDGYDLIVSSYLDHKIPWKKLCTIGWVANSFNNLFAFGGLTGVAIRSLWWKRAGASTQSVINTSSIIIPAFPVGLSFMSLLAVLSVPGPNFWGSAGIWLKPALWLLSAYLPVYFLLQRINSLAKKILGQSRKVKWSTSIALAIVSIIEWSCAVALLNVVLHTLNISVPLLKLIGIYVVAAAVGIFSFVPGGLGTFDTVLIIGLSGFAPASQATAVVLLYRVFYYFIPWLIGWVLATKEWLTGDIRFLDRLRSWIKQTSLYWLLVPFDFLSNLGIKAISFLVFASGLILLLSAATPGLYGRMRFLEQFVPIFVLKGSHILSVIAGAFLLILSRAIVLRLEQAWIATEICLIFGSVFTFLKGLDFEEATLLLVLALFLYPMKSKFYRKGAKLDASSFIGWGAMATAFLFAYQFLAYDLTHGDTLGKWLHYTPIFKLSTCTSPTCLIVAIVATWTILFLWMILKPARVSFRQPSNDQLSKISEFLKRNKGNDLIHLVYLRDKAIFWAADEKMLIQYAPAGRYLVALGDPVGPNQFLSLAIGEFRSFADLYNMHAVFYQVVPENLPLYHDNGYHFFKLGEEAIVDLEKFSISGKAGKQFRNVLNRFNKEGYYFRIVSPPFPEVLWKQLEQISSEWIQIKGGAEKTFSVGRFDRFYLEQAPVAIVGKDSKTEVAAFASIMPLYDEKGISIDLMRYRNSAPHGTMDFLFVNLFRWARDNGYREFRLGMAPFSNVGETPFASVNEKLARLIYDHGNKFYHFHGLRQYKEKFNPQWKPRFLAYPMECNPVRILLGISVLISGGYRRLLTKVSEQKETPTLRPS